MRHCIPRSEWHFWHFGVQIAASQNRPEVLIAESVAVLEPGVNRTPVVENKERRGHNQRAAHPIVPLETVPQIENRRNRKNRQRNNLLNRLQLRGRELIR